MRTLERLLMALFPPHFRERFDGDLRAAFESSWQDVSGVHGPLVRWRRRGALIADFVGTALRARLDMMRSIDRPRVREGAGGLALDLRFAFKQLRRHPTFTAAVVITMGLGIGANTAVFSVLYGVLLKPLPFENPGELVYLWGDAAEAGMEPFWTPPPEPLEAISLLSSARAVLSGDGPARYLPVVRTDARHLEVLGVSMSRGRWFTPVEAADRSPVVVLRAAEAAGMFGEASRALGRELVLDGVAHEVIGVVDDQLAESFRFQRTRAWLPLGRDMPPRFSIIARLRDGVSLEAARRRLNDRFTADPASPALSVEPLHELVVGWHRPLLRLLYAAVAVVLLLACVNVAHLFLVRGQERRRELAVRAALGAGRGRLVRQLLTEGVLTAMIGGGLGLILAPTLIGALAASFPTEVARLSTVRIDRAVLAYSLGTTVLAGLALGALPALAVGRQESGFDLARARSDAGGASSRRIGAALMITQVALALTVVAAGGLLLRTFWTLMPSAPGFDPRAKLTFQLSLPTDTYDLADTRSFFSSLLEEVRGLPQVVDAAMVSDLPFTGATIITPIHRDGVVVAGEPGLPAVHVRLATPEYVSMLRFDVQSGSLAGTDPTAAYLNSAAAAALWPEGSPVGGAFEVVFQERSVALRVAAVLADARIRGNDVHPRPEVFVPFDALPYRRMTVVVETLGAPLSLADEVIAAVHRLDPLLPVEEMSSLDQILADSVRTQRFNAFLMVSLGSLTLLLAAVGVFGVMARGVGGRREELGIRMALGATGRRVAGMVLAQAGRNIAAGFALGLAAAAVGASVLESQLYGVTATDPWTLATAGLLLGVTGLVAAALPALRAARIDPVESIRRA